MFTNKLNKLLIAILLTAISSTLHAQDIKDKSENVTDVEFIQGVILPLNETQKIRYEYPQKLNYWEYKSGPSTFANYPNNMKAKVEVRDGKPVDYRFIFVSSGLEYKGNSGLIPFSGGKGQVINITYSFPCQLEVRDANDNLLKTFILDDGTREYTTTYSPDFFAYEQVTADFNYEVKPTKGFTQKDEQILKTFSEKEKDILARAEYNQMARVGRQAYDIIYAGYGGLKTSKPSVLTIEKKYKDKFPELDAAITKLTANVATFYTGVYDDNLRKEFSEAGQYFASQYDDNSSKGMKKICSYNSALAYSLAGLHNEAYEQYQIAYKQYGLLSSPSNLAKIFDCTTQMYDMMEAKDVAVFDYKEPHTLNYRSNQIYMAHRNKKQAELDALLAYNVNKKPATIIDKDGNEHNGTLEMTIYKQGESGIIDLDFGKVALLTYEDGKGKFFKTGNTKYIKVGDMIYEPVKEKENTGMKILKIASTGSAGAYFMPRVFEHGDYIVYYNVQYDDYLIKNKNEEDAYSLITLKGKGKDAKAFREGCSELENKITNKEIETNLEGAKTYVKLLADCKK
jgi:hypothetical protein